MKREHQRSSPRAIRHRRRSRSPHMTMRDQDCVRFLQWALPRLRLRWAGFRRVRRQLCKRIGRRLRDMKLTDTNAYAAFLEAHPGEWSHLDGLCRVTISRFYRDRAVFDHLRRAVLPKLARPDPSGAIRRVRCWSAGCASGEEPYTLAAVWECALRGRFPLTVLRIIATDADARMLARARVGIFAAGSLRDLPAAWIVHSFDHSGNRYVVRPPLRRLITFRRQDLRRARPAGPLDLVLCRNLAFTYFDDGLQREVLAHITRRVRPGGALVIGSHERLPAGAAGFVSWEPHLGIYRRTGAG
ncbi:MAG: chemotaxis protein CheR [Acidobacteria bacterium]|nr:chemotaxis protein CheR [Acidobacteriota bacterium]